LKLEFEEISNKHDRPLFDCGVPALNDYLKRFAQQNHKKNISLTFVATLTDSPRTILGYYCVSMAQIEFDSLPTPFAKGLPRYPVPAMRIGRLAVSLEARGKGVGRDLLMDAFHRALEAAKSVGVFAIVVDAKDETAKNFYKKYQFTELLDHPKTLFILLSTLKDALR
jgi:predicted GNAT family N-acyltransferase